jgi:5-formyltetrahydrofolate cyclo-ligase
MSAAAALQKQALRLDLRRVLRTIPPEIRTAASQQAWRILEAQAVWQQARAVFLFWPLDNELDSRPLIESALRQRKRVALPRFNAATGAYEAARVNDLETDLSPGRLGILEPREACPAADLIRLDFTLVPGLGFGLDGRRLGRGKGFYDRMLARVSGWKCGAALDEQIVEGIPQEPHDVCVDCLLTPVRWQVVRPPPVLE